MNLCSLRQSYIARLLEGGLRQRVEQHLETCAACKTAVVEAAKLDAALGAWLEAQSTPAATEGGARRLVRVVNERRARRPRLVLVWSATTAIAAALVISWWARSPVAGPSERDGPPSVAAVEWTVVSNEGGVLAPARPDEPRVAEVVGAGRLVVHAAGDVLSLGAHTRAELSSAGTGHTRIRLLRGFVAVHAAHRGTTGSLSVEAGGYAVNVVGTRFSVEWDGVERLQVVVSEGQVMVVQPDGRLRMVRAGQRLQFDADSSSEGSLAPPSERETTTLDTALQAAPAPVEPETPASAPVTRPPSSGAGRRPRAESPPSDAAPPDEATIRQWLLDGDTAHAERALLARLADSPREAASWWLLGETRRRAGRPGDAVTAYRRVIELGNPSEANRARYQVALLLEERLDDAPGAIALYQAYLANSPRPLEAAAQLRLGRLLSARGEHAASTVLEDLRRLHPGTPEAEQATRLLEGR